MYPDPGVGGAELAGVGFRPNSFLCDGVSGMSVTSSGLRYSGASASRTLVRQKRRSAARA